MRSAELAALVTGGLDALLRRPISAGLLLAVAGTALIAEILWLLVFPVCCVDFVYSAIQKERLMMAAFPVQYAACKHRTRNKISCVW